MSSKSARRLTIPGMVALLAAVLLGAALACDLNVREAGFLNNAAGPYFPMQYKLVMVAAEETPETKQLAERLAKLEREDLDGSNFSVALFQAAKISARDREMMKEDGIDLAKLPVSFLFVQTDTDRQIVFTENRLFSTDDVLALAASPAKMKLQKLLADNNNYHALVLLPSSDRKANSRAEKAVAAGIQACAPRLPKQKIALLQVDRSAKAERFFLKELGIEPGPEPACAVVFGKGRMAVPLLKGEEITAERLTEMLGFLQHNASDCTPDAVYLPGSVVDMIMPWSDKLDAAMYEAIAKSGVIPDLVWTDAEVDPATGELIDRGPK